MCANYVICMTLLYPAFKGTYKKLDEYNLIVEFYGDYWHRNPKIYNDNISENIRIKD